MVRVCNTGWGISKLENVQKVEIHDFRFLIVQDNEYKNIRSTQCACVVCT